MNQMNRAMLLAAAQNPAEIAAAACGSGQLPEYNPRGGPSGFGQRSSGMATNPAPNPAYKPAFRPRAPQYNYVPSQDTEFTSNLLSNAQKLWLHRRALWFGQILAQLKGPVAYPPNDIPDFAETAAVMAATGLVGDDYDPITKNATAGWSQQQFTAAYDYVADNMAAWWADAYGGQ